MQKINNRLQRTYIIKIFTETSSCMLLASVVVSARNWLVISNTIASISFIYQHLCILKE